jgi:ribonucleoside-triphosphate reductase
MTETTDLNLFVRTSEETISEWSREKIVDAMMRETLIDYDTAVGISKDVESLVRKSGIKIVTAPLIREMVNARLIERGLEHARRMHTRLGMPIYDVDTLILHPNKENANVPHGPEATNLTLAERIKKEYALLSVFSQDIADAHMRGDLHLHDLLHLLQEPWIYIWNSREDLLDSKGRKPLSHTRQASPLIQASSPSSLGKVT